MCCRRSFSLSVPFSCLSYLEKQAFLSPLRSVFSSPYRVLLPVPNRPFRTIFSTERPFGKVSTKSAPKRTKHANRRISSRNSLTKVLTQMHMGVYAKMPTKTPTKVEILCAKHTRWVPWRHPQEGSREIWQCSRKCTRKCARSIFTCPFFTLSVSCPNNLIMAPNIPKTFEPCSAI